MPTFGPGDPITYDPGGDWEPTDGTILRRGVDPVYPAPHARARNFWIIIVVDGEGHETEFNVRQVDIRAQDATDDEVLGGGGYKKRKSKRKSSKKRKSKKSRGGAKKRTVRKSKKKENNDSLYFEFDRLFGKGKFWRITKNGTKITTHYGKMGTLGQMTTKEYGSKVDKKFDSLVQSKKKKGYVEKEYYGHVSESNPKPPTKVEREYLRICNKAEKSKVLNPNAINQDCEAMLDQGESELKWFTEWHKDALKKGEYDWQKYEEHSKSKRNKKRKK
jgi:predicted DNA-binding WGR domain protein